MITEVTGDLLDADVDALVNTVNCVGVMGKGIALQFKRRYPHTFREYEQACKRGEVTIGRMFVVPTGQVSGPKFIINFPTKKHWRSPSKLEYIERGLGDLYDTIRNYKIASIAIPPLGTGNGGLAWDDVEPIIHDALGALTGVDIRLYVPSAAHRPIVANPGIRLTWGRAILISLIEAYVTRRAQIEPWEDPYGASHLEIQKLMYFANEVEPRLRLNFEQGRYGPYAERVRHLVQEAEGCLLQGYGDGTDPVLSLAPIAPTRHALGELARYVHREDVSRIVKAVLRQIEGFEGPYGLELLASTHWVMAHNGPKNAPEHVREWTHRKGRIFTDNHVKAAMTHLQLPEAI